MRGRQLRPGQIGSVSTTSTDGLFIAVVRVCPSQDAGTVRLKRTGTTKGEARKRVLDAAESLVEEHARPRQYAGAPLALASLCATRIERLAQDGKVRPQSVRTYERGVRALVQRHGNTDMASVTPSQLAAMLQTTYGDHYGSWRLAMIVVKGALADAVADGLLNSNVARELRPPPKPRPRPRAFAPEQQRELLQRLRRPVYDIDGKTQIGSLATVYSDAAILELRSGARIGEVTALTWDKHVKFLDTENAVVIHFSGTVVADGKAYRQEEPKTSTSWRYVKITDTAVVEMLRRRRRDAGPEQIRVFPGEKGGWLSPHTVQAYWRKRKRGTELDERWVTPHAARRTYVTDQIKSGRTYEMVARVVGHADPDTTRRVYTEIYPDILDA